ncbi:MAG TPA: hypothetical protein VGB82_15460 [Alphaproteobacteria bacterium]
MPRSRPTRRVATPPLGFLSMYQVPWPITGTFRLVAPKECCLIATSSTACPINTGGAAGRSALRRSAT